MINSKFLGINSINSVTPSSIRAHFKKYLKRLLKFYKNIKYLNQFLLKGIHICKRFLKNVERASTVTSVVCGGGHVLKFLLQLKRTFLNNKMDRCFFSQSWKAKTQYKERKKEMWAAACMLFFHFLQLLRFHFCTRKPYVQFQVLNVISKNKKFWNISLHI